MRKSLIAMLTALFSLFTIFCVVLLQGTPYRIGLANLGEGFSFHLPAAAIGVGDRESEVEVQSADLGGRGSIKRP